jgi:hypothetical protein
MRDRVRGSGIIGVVSGVAGGVFALRAPAGARTLLLNLMAQGGSTGWLR